jgi:hypothetical protein
VALATKFHNDAVETVGNKSYQALQLDMDKIGGPAPTI